MINPYHVHQLLKLVTKERTIHSVIQALILDNPEDCSYAAMVTLKKPSLTAEEYTKATDKARKLSLLFTDIACEIDHLILEAGYRVQEIPEPSCTTT